jgi:hypothetical protein
MRPTKRLFEVHKSSAPNGSKYWFIIGRPSGARIRARFATEKEAKAEADKRSRNLAYACTDNFYEPCQRCTESCKV